MDVEIPENAKHHPQAGVRTERERGRPESRNTGFSDHTVPHRPDKAVSWFGDGRSRCSTHRRSCERRESTPPLPADDAVTGTAQPIDAAFGRATVDAQISQEYEDITSEQKDGLVGGTPFANANTVPAITTNTQNSIPEAEWQHGYHAPSVCDAIESYGYTRWLSGQDLLDPGSICWNSHSQAWCFPEPARHDQ